MRLSVAKTSVPDDLIAKLETTAETEIAGIELLSWTCRDGKQVGKRAAAFGLTV